MSLNKRLKCSRLRVYLCFLVSVSSHPVLFTYMLITHPIYYYKSNCLTMRSSIIMSRDKDQTKPKTNVFLASLTNNDIKVEIPN